MLHSFRSMQRSSLLGRPTQRFISNTRTMQMAGCGSGGCGSGGCGSKRKNTHSLLSAEEALSLSSNPGSCAGAIKFVDASWHMDKARSGFNEFLRCRIKGAQFFDVDAVSDTSSSLPHMLPSEQAFAEAAEAMGISNEDHVVVYSVADSFAAARVWWTFRLFGHEKVSVLQGGLTGWIDINGPLESGPVSPVPKGHYVAKKNAKMVVTAQDVLQVVNTGSGQILDARSAARFFAQVPEPRAGLPSGHIPGSLSLPFGELVQAKDLSSFKSVEEIRDAILDSGIVLGSKVVLTCGSGVSAAVLAFGMHLIGQDLEAVPIYDGSWTEWGADKNLPKITAADLEDMNKA